MSAKSLNSTGEQESEMALEAHDKTQLSQLHSEVQGYVTDDSGRVMAGKESAENLKDTAIRLDEGEGMDDLVKNNDQHIIETAAQKNIHKEGIDKIRQENCRVMAILQRLIHLMISHRIVSVPMNPSSANQWMKKEARIKRRPVIIPSNLLGSRESETNGNSLSDSKTVMPQENQKLNLNDGPGCYSECRRRGPLLNGLLHGRRRLQLFQEKRKKAFRIF